VPHELSTREHLHYNQVLDWLYFCDTVTAFQKEASTFHFFGVLDRLWGFCTIVRDTVINSLRLRNVFPILLITCKRQDK